MKWHWSAKFQRWKKLWECHTRNAGIALNSIVDVGIVGKIVTCGRALNGVTKKVLHTKRYESCFLGNIYFWSLFTSMKHYLIFSFVSLLHLSALACTCDISYPNLLVVRPLFLVLIGLYSYNWMILRIYFAGFRSGSVETSTNHQQVTWINFRYFFILYLCYIGWDSLRVS